MAKETSGIVGVSRQSFNLEVDAREYGFEPTETPRTDRSVKPPKTRFFHTVGDNVEIEGKTLVVHLLN